MEIRETRETKYYIKRTVKPQTILITTENTLTDEIVFKLTRQYGQLFKPLLHCDLEVENKYVQYKEIGFAKPLEKYELYKISQERKIENVKKLLLDTIKTVSEHITNGNLQNYYLECYFPFQIQLSYERSDLNVLIKSSEEGTDVKLTYNIQLKF